MVFMKFKCRPEDEKATLGVRITTVKPGISLKTLNSAKDATVLEIQIHLRCLKSVNPEEPITFCTSGSLFETAKPEAGNMDNLALGMLAPGLVCNNPKDNTVERKVISLGNYRRHKLRQENDDATNLLDRPGMACITVPSQKSQEEVTFTHTLSNERLFAFAEKIGPGDLKLGEKYEMHISDNYIGAMWWCWGSLEDELRGKKLHSFSEGLNVIGTERPSDDEIEKEGWVIGEDISQLRFIVEDGGATCSVEVVE